MSTPDSPPAVARRLLARALPVDVREHILNELDEVYQYKYARHGAAGARLWYCREVMVAVALAARCLPARRASAVDPIEALR